MLGSMNEVGGQTETHRHMVYCVQNGLAWHPNHFHDCATAGSGNVFTMVFFIQENHIMVSLEVRPIEYSPPTWLHILSLLDILCGTNFFGKIR